MAINTPLWVWLIFIHLVVIGVLSLKDRVVSLTRLFIMPVILIGFRYKVFISYDFMLIGTYVICLLAGINFGLFVGNKTPIQILKQEKSVLIPGHRHTLGLLMLLFWTKYAYGVWKAVSPFTASQYANAETGFSALISGYFLGRSLYFLKKYIHISKKVKHSNNRIESARKLM